MNKDLRWRIIILQVVMIVVFGFGAGIAYYAGNFTHDQIKAQLEPQQIFFPAVGKGLPEGLNQYAGQQVLTGEQAHAYADQFIALHLSEMGDPAGKPYSYWSGVARTETDPVKKAAANDLVDTIFRGDTLRSMLNQAWAFGTMGDIAIYVSIGLALAALLVVGTLAFELFVAPKRVLEPSKFAPIAASPREETTRPHNNKAKRMVRIDGVLTILFVLLHLTSHKYPVLSSTATDKMLLSPAIICQVRRGEIADLYREETTVAKSAKTVVEVVELGGSKVLLVEVLTAEQLEWVYEVFEPYSRKYRGQYQSLAKTIVQAHDL